MCYGKSENYPQPHIWRTHHLVLLVAGSSHYQLPVLCRSVQVKAVCEGPCSEFLDMLGSSRSERLKYVLTYSTASVSMFKCVLSKMKYFLQVRSNSDVT